MLREQFVCRPYFHSWAEGGSTLLCFGTAAMAPPTGRSRDRRTAVPGRRGSPPQWRRAGGAQRSPAWGNLERPGMVFGVGDRATVTLRAHNREGLKSQTVVVLYCDVFEVQGYIWLIFVKLVLPAQKMLLRFTLTRPTTPVRKSGHARTFPLWVTWEAGQLLARTLIYGREKEKIRWYNIHININILQLPTTVSWTRVQIFLINPEVCILST